MEQRNLLSAGAAGRLLLSREVISSRLARGPGASRRSDAANALRLGAPAGDLRDEAPPDKMLIAAAVLVPLVQRPDGMTVLLTQRTAHLANHAGQISFPGGRIEACDDDALAAALRETEEEIGLSPDKVEVLGWLDDYVTGTGFRVTPIVGAVEPPFELRPDPFEVAEAFEVPLDFILDPVNHRRVRRVVAGRDRPYYAMPFRDRYIWGATAGMLINLFEVLSE